MSADLLLEIGCEDLPARFVMPLAEALRSGVVGGLETRQVGFGDVKVFATPRRLAVQLSQVDEQQPEQSRERLGPALAAAMRDGEPTKAALGFARSCGVEFSELGEKDGKLYFSKTEPGRATSELLPEIFEEALKGMDQLVPKRMRWGDGDETFVRPVQWLLCMLGAKAVPLARFGLTADNKTYGHRFHAPKAIALKSPAEYERALTAAKVWASFDLRREEVRKQVEAEAAQLKGSARITEDLLDEVTALVEWPVAIHGRMEEEFMQLPPEVIISTIETNQRYFPVFGSDKNLLPYFITVANIESRDVQQVVEGNERVVRPRLSDALFFWEQDRKKSLTDHSVALGRVTFQKDLGSIAQKVTRVAKLAKHIASQLKVDATAVERSASLCKADLVTRMVFEIPELQGVIGGYYAEAGGESKDVALAIREHYQPTGAGGAIPSTPLGQVVALADKLDTLAGIFAIGQKPTASKDPYALRRAALGALRICIEGKLSLDLGALLDFALQAQAAGKKDPAVLNALSEFVLERLRAYYETLPVEMYEAVKALEVSDPLDFDARIQALREFWELPAAKNLAAAHKRVRNILKQAGDSDDFAPDKKLFEHDAETALASSMEKVEGTFAASDYADRLKSLATLKEPVDAFFDGVMVNAEDEALKNNRLALLRQLDRLCREVADISCLPG